MYDAATALGEAATLSQRVRAVSGDRVLVPATPREGKRGTLEQYARGPDLRVDAYPTEAGTADVAGLRERLDDDVAMVYAETPTTCGAIEADLAAIGEAADDHDALFVLGSDPVALALLERPADVGADVVGEAGVLGLGTAYGMDLGLFVTREESLRQVPGRLVGAGEDATGRRAYTLTLQTREQHIRKERATSNIRANQAWLALRAAVHAALLGPDGLVDLAEECVRLPRDLAARRHQRGPRAGPRPPPLPGVPGPHRPAGPGRRRGPGGRGLRRPRRRRPPDPGLCHRRQRPRGRRLRRRDGGGGLR